jgi:hypothetical protein
MQDRAERRTCRRNGPLPGCRRRTQGSSPIQTNPPRLSGTAPIAGLGDQAATTSDRTPWERFRSCPVRSIRCREHNVLPAFSDFWCPKKPCSRRESPPTPGQPGITMTGLSRRRSRVRVPSLSYKTILQMASFVAWLGANDCRFLHKCRCVPAGLEKCLSAGTFAASGRTARLQSRTTLTRTAPQRSKWGKWIATDPGCCDSPFPASGQLGPCARSG